MEGEPTLAEKLEKAVWTPKRFAFLQPTLESVPFQLSICILILANATFIALTTNLAVERAYDEYEMSVSISAVVTLEEPTWVSAGETVFSLLFAAELLLRIFALGCEFLTASGW